MAASALLLGAVSCAEKKAESPAKKEISVQLYSIRSVIGNPELYAQNHEEAFKALAEMGYTSVEAACYSDGKLYGVDPGQATEPESLRRVEQGKDHGLQRNSCPRTE